MRKKICQTLTDLYNQYAFLLESGCLKEAEREFFQRVSPDMADCVATLSLESLSCYLSRYYKKEVIMEDTLQNALEQIEARGYAAGLR